MRIILYTILDFSSFDFNRDINLIHVNNVRKLVSSKLYPKKR